ncbi:TetR/AcrR family transcriptional regulator [Flexibacterium corallicola]|uniref:TetR/AcrR family transcriptional regulator n=1 Tax=Flexibacterium corallicola TaxID=3037259 RepID=UPI00286F81CD|nr:TetR/AcrR family transcriptional regulator [Pseudovibrio sp. M1P-2-3]
MASGRKPKFDRNDVLDAAMRVFWKKGFAGTSMSDLTDATGLNKPSLYGAFGNKEALFLAGLERYMEHYIQPRFALLSEEGTPLRTRLKNYLIAVMRLQSETQAPYGCYMSQCISDAASDILSEPSTKTILETNSANVETITALLCNDSEAKSLKLDKNAEDLALFLITIMHGTAALARSGVTTEKLERVADRAITALGLPEEEPAVT